MNNIRNIAISEFHNCAGLAKGYNMDICQAYLQKRFPNIRRIVLLNNNPNVERVRVAGAKYNDLIGIVLDFNHITNFTEIIETAKQRLGWFTDQIDIRQKVKSGHIPYRFHYVNGNYFCPDRRGGIDLSDFLCEDPQLSSFSVIVEEKFGEVYHQKPDEFFYHAADSGALNKILAEGLRPVSQGNFPERIYLVKKMSEISHLVEGSLNDMVFLRVDVSKLRLFKLYKNQRNTNAVFTYDTILPSQIEMIDAFK